MEYICGDRGTDKCPCVLMETGQCYTCGMISRGKCDCLASWQGVCPYSEYVQNGRSVMGRAEKQKYEIKSVEDFSEKLKVIAVSVPMGFALECRKPGSFLMVDSDGFKTPVSVMEASVYPESLVRLTVYIAGPKTAAIDRLAERGGFIELYGPFSNGLINFEKFDRNRLSLVIGKGMAFIPALNCMDAAGGGLLSAYIDESKLTREFLNKYVLPRLEYRSMDFASHAEELKTAVEGDIRFCAEHTGEKPNVFLMVSPYYAEAISSLCGFSTKEIITPNHANMCCGEGVCGACSYTDKSGRTVKMCKCIDMV